MTIVLPRLPMGEASNLLALVQEGSVPAPALHHASEVYPSVGVRLTRETAQKIRDELHEAASRFGMPAAPLRDAASSFDKAARRILPDLLPLTWAEASNRQMWSWLTLVLLPDITAWRWSAQTDVNSERWIAHDLTRHTWARLWWQATTFEGDLDLLDRFGESDLNQFFERRELGGRPALVVALARSVDEALAAEDVTRRDLIRDVTKRLRRVLAFTEYAALDSVQLQRLADRLVSQSMEAMTAGLHATAE